MEYIGLYPEIRQEGSLRKVVDIELMKIGSLLTTQSTNNSTLDASIKSKTKFSDISIASKKRLYFSDYWADGRILCTTQTQNISLLI